MRIPSRIVVGIDFSRSSHAALKHAARLADKCGASLFPIHITEPFATLEGMALGQPAARRIVARARAVAHEHLVDWAGGTGLTNDRMTPVSVVGSPWTELVLHCKKVGADMLVLGARGAGPAHEVGALASRCVRRAPLRVMLIRRFHSHPFKKVLACVDFSLMSKAVLREAAGVAELDGAALHALHVVYPPLGDRAVPGSHAGDPLRRDQRGSWYG